MKELTDLEICERIAEIEGLDFPFNAYRGNGLFLYLSDDHETEFNPLTDKALCFDLMVKYRITIRFSHRLWKADTLDKHKNLIRVRDKDPQRAICLAIIEAHKGK